MSEILHLLFAASIGTILGAAFYGGLWWTVNRGVKSPIPAVWFLVSQVVRTGGVLIGFLLAAGGHWQRAVACMAGFFISRILVDRFIGRNARTAGALEATNANAT